MQVQYIVHEYYVYDGSHIHALNSLNKFFIRSVTLQSLQSRGKVSFDIKFE
jgi:hypothetical protein